MDLMTPIVTNAQGGELAELGQGPFDHPPESARAVLLGPAPRAM
jgi:hypothetical protein